MRLTPGIFRPGECRSCGVKLTAEDRAQFKGAWTDSAPFPDWFKRYIKQYCVKCVRAYQLSQMNDTQRVEWLKETRKELMAKTHSDQDKAEAREQLTSMGLKQAEVDYLLQGL